MRAGGGSETTQGAPRNSRQAAGETQLPTEDDASFGQPLRESWGAPEPPGIGEGAGAPASQAGRPRTTTDGMVGQAGRYDPEAEDEAPSRKRDRRDEDGEVAPERMRERGEGGREEPTDMDWSSLEWSPVASGVATRLLSPGHPGASSDTARVTEAMENG